MMKKMMAVMTMLALLTCAVAGFAQSAETGESPVLLSGEILEVTQEGILLDVPELGEVQAWITQDTVLEGVEELEPGQFAVVLYNGMMTRSLPPQITAQRVSVYAVEGTVIEAQEDRVTILRADGMGDVVVTLPQDAPALCEGDRVTAYTTGIMTMSLPPIVNGIGFSFPVTDAEATPGEAQP